MNWDAERERWVLWLPVAVGGGIALYFALPVEPPAWIGPWVLLASGGLAWIGRRRLAVLLMAVTLVALAMGFSVAMLRTHDVAAPVLSRPIGFVHLEGRISDVEPRENGVRVILDHLRLSRAIGGSAPPERVRIHLNRGGEDVRAGQWIGVDVSLLPPPSPVAPGAYDFRRQAWFLGLGAVGFAMGRPVVLAEPPAEGWGEGLRLSLAHARHALTRRIVEKVRDNGLSESTAATAAALITAERGPVPPEILQSFRDAGLAHILVIAGMHMSMVAGLVFVIVRGGLAAVPWVALRYSIKTGKSFYNNAL